MKWIAKKVAITFVLIPTLLSIFSFITLDDLKQNQFIDMSKFKVDKLNKFDIRGISRMELMGLVQLNDAEKSKYLQSSLKIDNDMISLDKLHFFFYSVQENTSQKKVITIIELNEDCCIDLLYLVYDENNKLLSNFKVAGNGEDGGWSYQSYGKFPQENKYEMIKVTQEMVGWENNKTIFQIDSVVTQYSLNNSYKFELTKEEKFQRKSEEKS